MCEVRRPVNGNSFKRKNVKKMYDRKMDREGQSDNCLADALFRITLDLRLHWRAELHISSVQNMLSNVQENHRETSSRAVLFIADRGYGMPEFMEFIRGFGYNVFSLTLST